jgi:hypothetical protein
MVIWYIFPRFGIFVPRKIWQPCSGHRGGSDRSVPELNQPTTINRDASGVVDVMITIFCDFRQFSAKKLAFLSKTNFMIKILDNLALF